MAQTNGEALIAETEKYLNQTNAAQAESETTALPFETPDEYIDDPTGFSDVAAKLWNKVNTVFDLAVKYNRHSPDYLKSLAQLEKGIKFLGSCCLQKYALEMQKQVFPDLARLNTVNLYKMTAIHFNKIDRALTEYIDEHQTVDDGLLDMEYRYYNLMERLRATEVKIYNYRDNYYFGKKNYDPVIHGSAFSGKSWEKELHEHDEPMPFQRAKAFPVQQPAVGAQQPADSCQQSAVSSQQSTVSGQQPAVGGQQPAVSGQCSANETESQETHRTKAHVVCPDDAAKPAQQDCTQGAATNIEAHDVSSDKDAKETQQDCTQGAATNIEAHDVSSDTNAKETQQDCTQGAATNIEAHDVSSDTDTKETQQHRTVTAELPQCIQILNQVVMRSRIRGLDYLGFTEREMRLLAADPMFDVFDPVMAADLRRALAEHDDSS